jgi:vacuolar-type H+-ATPase subunit H
MDSFDQVAGIEKKYDQKISQLKKQAEKEFDTFKEHLHDEEAAMKNDYKRELEQSLRKERDKLKSEGEELVKKAKNEALAIRKRANTDKIVKKLKEEISNV